MVKVTTLRQRILDRLVTVAASTTFAGLLFVGHSLTHPEPDPKVVMAEEAKAIRCIPRDENTTCIMKRRGHYLEAVKHTELTEKQRLVLMNLVYPLPGSSTNQR
jgi:hypothetical protein